MKYSMKRQLTMVCTLLIVGTILLCYLLNSLFLGDYYTNKKKKALRNAYLAVNEAFREGNIDSDEFDVELRSICGKYNLDMVVIDEKTAMVKASDHDPQKMVEQLLSHFFQQSDQEEQKSYKLLEQKDRYTLQISYDYGMHEDYIEMWGLLENGNLFLIRSSLEGIRDSVTIANSFLAYAAIGSICFSVVVSNLLSRKMTKPIMELAQVSSEMKNLNFQVKYQGESKTEIALLGQNINELSETLEKTISELKTANNELQNDLERKIKEEERRKEFLSNVSHELKTPIALIQGYAEGLREGVIEDTESKAYYLEVIMDEAGKMDRLVKALMTLDQLEAGKEPVTMERFDLGGLLHNYLQSMELFMEQKGICVEESVAQPLYVWGDAFRIQEVISNYLSNAINHVKENEAFSQKTIRVSTCIRDNKAIVSVFNSGDTIPEESIPYLWDKFYKVDKARTREYGGSGIGLSIVKAIMQSMHQEYGIRNHENGVEFFFCIEVA